MSSSKKLDLGLQSAYDELFLNEKGRAENRLPKIYDIPLSEIDEFPNHPYQVRMDEDMTQLVESVKERGIITPVILRKKATELNLKRLIVGGIERVYEIGRIFRNEGMDTRHNPEFTSVELYESYADFNDMMDLFEELLSGAAMELLGTYDVTWQGEKVSLAPPFRRMTMAEAVKEFLGVDFMAITSDEEAVKAAKAVGVDMEKVEPTWGHALYECYDQKVEEKMVQPTFITMHPVDVSPLAKRSPKDPRLTERFELFICRSEMGNAFSELNDPIDQEQRFLKQMELRAKGDEEAGMMDTDFINALEYGMPH